jgi:hypothetical protein
VQGKETVVLCIHNYLVLMRENQLSKCRMLVLCILSKVLSMSMGMSMSMRECSVLYVVHAKAV